MGLCRLGPCPRVLVTDKLSGYGVAQREVLPGVEHRRSRYLDNLAEYSHQPTRQRERAMKRFKSAGHAQRLPAAALAAIGSPFADATTPPEELKHAACVPGEHLAEGHWSPRATSGAGVHCRLVTR